MIGGLRDKDYHNILEPVPTGYAHTLEYITRIGDAIYGEDSPVRAATLVVSGTVAVEATPVVEVSEKVETILEVSVPA